MQHLFSMFGATVLVPLLVGLNPGVALTSGVGTLLHLLITRGKVPLMGSSFFHYSHDVLAEDSWLSSRSAGIISVGLVYLVVASL